MTGQIDYNAKLIFGECFWAVTCVQIQGKLTFSTRVANQVL